MKQQPDTFFRSKLKDHSKFPPPSVWERIDGGLDRNKKVIYFQRIAASIAIVLAAGLLAVPIETQLTTEPVARIKIEEAPPVLPLPSSARKDVLESAPAPAKPEQQSRTENITASREPSLQNSGADDNRPKQNLSQAEPTAALDLPQATASRDTAEENQLPSEDIADSFFSPEPDLAYHAGDHSSVTIILTAEQSQEYFVDNNMTQATSEERKSSTFKKVLKKAADLSTNQDPFGDLRQKKNELLAFHFKSDKQRGQKK